MDSPRKSQAFGVEKRLRQIQPSDARPRSVPSAGARTTRPRAWLGQEIPRLYYRIWRRTTGPGSFSGSGPRPSDAETTARLLLALFPGLWRSSRTGQDDVVEVHASGAGDVNALYRLEPAHPQGPPG